jgi:ribose 5-phosphate isomerase
MQICWWYQQNPAELENKINMIPGVVENGLLPETKRFGKFRS